MTHNIEEAVLLGDRIIVLHSLFLSLTGGSLPITKLSAAAFGFFAGIFIANVFAAAYDVISKQDYGLVAGILNLIGGLTGCAGILAAGV